MFNMGAESAFIPLMNGNDRLQLFIEQLIFT
jgi:hypothetical protein